MSSGYLKVGSGMGAKILKMSNVKAAQKALNACTNSSLVVDGKIGINTTGVFKNFQTSKSIAADGVIGPVTAGKLADCSVGTTTNRSTGSSSTLSGGAGDLQDVNVLSTYSNEKVKEGQSDAKVLAFEIEADNGSDLLISNVRLSFEQIGTGSKRMNKYIEGVKVWQETKEVGSADESDFSENSDVYSRAINLSNAVVKDGEKSKFYVSVDAISNIDSNDLGEDWSVTVDSIRFKDASGAIITDSSTGDLGNGKDFSFEDLTTSGDLELKVSKGTNSPIAQVVEADSVSDTPDVTLVEAKIKASGSDMAIDEIKFDVTPTGANSNEIVKEYKLMVDGKEIDSVDSPSIASNCTRIRNIHRS
jgi:peptidoglycan hydrolase-like protein with peptidoglycan-binding domain